MEQKKAPKVPQSRIETEIARSERSLIGFIPPLPFRSWCGHGRHDGESAQGDDTAAVGVPLRRTMMRRAFLDRQGVFREGDRLRYFVIAGRSLDKPRADIQRPWEAVRRRAALQGVRLYDLRHSFASVGAGASLGLPIVGKLLGHSQAATTLGYTHLDANPLRRAANTIATSIALAMAGGNRVEEIKKENASRPHERNGP